MKDFMSATTTVQARRSRPQELTVKVTGGLQLPVAPPSPFFDGMNEDINIEPFPEFVDPCPPIKVEALHCVLHCKDNVCKRMVCRELWVPPCRCGDEVDQKSTCVTTPPSKGPVISLDDTIFAAIKDAESNIDADQTIEVQRDDARTLIEQFEMFVARRAFKNKEFMAAIRGHAPRRHEDAARNMVISYIFQLLSLYFERTMRNAESRKITPQDLRAELKLYLWTGMEEWIIQYSNNWEHDEIFDNCPDTRLIVEAANFGLAGAVSKLWTECLDDILCLFIWHDVQVQKCKANQKVVFFGLSLLGMYSFAAGISCICGYW